MVNAVLEMRTGWGVAWPTQKGLWVDLAVKSIMSWVYTTRFLLFSEHTQHALTTEPLNIWFFFFSEITFLQISLWITPSLSDIHIQMLFNRVDLYIPRRRLPSTHLVSIPYLALFFFIISITTDILYVYLFVFICHLLTHTYTHTHNC